MVGGSYKEVLMIKEYICKKCKYSFEDTSSDKFVKTTLRKCPMCGSSNVVLSNVSNQKFAKKTNK